MANYRVVGFDADAYQDPVPVGVDQWYDRSIRSWVTILVDDNGYQIGDANFDGDRAGAAISKARMAKQVPA